MINYHYNYAKVHGYLNSVYLNVMSCSFKKPPNIRSHLTSYYLHNTPFEIVENCNVTHTILSKHIHSITVKTSCTLSFLQRNLKPVPQLVFHWYTVQPQLEYACVIWSPYGKEEINHRAARFVTNIICDRI